MNEIIVLDAIQRMIFMSLLTTKHEGFFECIREHMEFWDVDMESSLTFRDNLLRRESRFKSLLKVYGAKTWTGPCLLH